MNLITLDFETYYSKEYGLKKYTTEEYIRDDQFETIGVAVKENDGDTKWCTGTDEVIAAFLRGFNWNNSYVVGHNMRFDAAILSWRYGIRPKGLGDTMGMGQILHGLTQSVSLKNLSEHYGIGEKGTEVLDALGKHRVDFHPNDLAQYGKYCINDVELTYKLFKLMLPHFTRTELKLIDLTIRMFTEPKLVLNKGLLLTHLAKVQNEKAELLANAGVEKDDLLSNPKFAELLRQFGVEPPMKRSPANPEKETYAFAKTDEEFKALLEHEDPRVQILTAARLGNKSTIEESRTEQFIHIANRGLLPVPLKYAGATVSHRWSGVDGINLQNLPRSSELRRAITAPKGYKVVASDLSNIELRLAYWFAGSTTKIEQIRQGVDLYKQSAADITGVPYDEVNKDLRFVFKVVNLSGIYGVGAAKMHSILKQGKAEKDLDDVKSIVAAYRASNPDLVAAWYRAGDMLSAVRANQSFSMGPNGIITSTEGGMKKPNGMILGLPNLRKIKNADGNGESWAYDKLFGRSLVAEYIHPAKTFQRCIQSLARDIIGDHIVAISKKYDVVLTVHDEICIVVPEADAEQALADMIAIMRTPPSWAPDLPLDAEGGIGDNYAEAK
jgi:DNA polymerase I-like protein with 3'-5' exonuclease and polymerase domains